MNNPAMTVSGSVYHKQHGDTRVCQVILVARPVIGEGYKVSLLPLDEHVCPNDPTPIRFRGDLHQFTEGHTWYCRVRAFMQRLRYDFTRRSY